MLPSWGPFRIISGNKPRLGTMSRSRELVKEVLEIPGRIEVLKNRHKFEKIYAGFVLTRDHKPCESHLKIRKLNCSFGHLLLSIPKSSAPPTENLAIFKEPPRPPPLKRLKKRRHQKVKSHGELRYQLDPQAPANFQIVGPRSVPEFFGLPKRVEESESARNLRGEVFVDKLIGELGQHWKLWIFLCFSGGVEVISKKTDKLSKHKKRQQINPTSKII